MEEFIARITISPKLTHTLRGRSAGHAGILASAILAVNVIVNYQQKLSDFLADLATESGQSGGAIQKVE